MFSIFQVPVEAIKVVILAQDPYYSMNTADGYAFSLKKTYLKEFPDRDYKWFENEGIFLLNCLLKVEKSNPYGYLEDVISENNDTCIFLLLGNRNRV